MSISSGGVLGLRLDPLTAGLMQADNPPAKAAAVPGFSEVLSRAKAPPQAAPPSPPPLSLHTPTRPQAKAAPAAEPEDTDGETDAAPASPQGGSFWSSDGPTFSDVLDILNPLQHIPVVSSIYRAITGDTESQGSSVVGGALFGGIAGLLASFLDSAVKDATGQDIGQHALAMFDSPANAAVASRAVEAGEDEAPPAAVAQAVHHYTLAQLRSAEPGAPTPTDVVA